MVIQIGKRIHALKLEIASTNKLIKKIVLALKVVFFEFFLGIISLPIYITKEYIKNYNLFNEAGMSYTIFCVRRKWTFISLSGILSVIVLSFFLSFFVELQHLHAAISWTERQPAGAADRTWWGLSSDADGSNLLAPVNNGRLYTSSDSGANWTERQPAGAADKAWLTVASDDDGSNLIAGVNGGRLYTSSDSGANWTERQPAGDADKFWTTVASDSDGSNLIAAVNNGRLYTSSDSGANWTERQPAGANNKFWVSVASDSDGSNLIAAVNTGRLYTSSDSGANWTERQPAGASDRGWRVVATDSIGQRLFAGIVTGRLYRSLDYGVTWAELQPAGATDKPWRGLAVNSDASSVFAGELRLYTGTETIPSIPSSITTSNVGSTSLTVSWTDNSSNESGFTLDQSTDGVTFINVGSTASNVTSYDVTSLSAGTSYWFRVAATSASGNSSYVTSTASVATSSNTAPDTPTSLTITPTSDGSGYFTIQFTVDDSENDVLKVKPEYKSGNCSSHSGYATTTITGSISATYGQSDITISSNDSNSFQIQNVTTTLGANTLAFSWDSSHDLPTGNAQYCIFITSNDGSSDSSIASTTVTVDNVSPSAPGALTQSSAATSSLTLAFGTAGSDTNFKEYKVFYKAGYSGVTVSDSTITSSSNSNLGSVNFNNSSSFSISSLSPNSQYVANIWAYDLYGHATPAATEVTAYTLANQPGVPTLTASTTSVINLVINQNSNPASTVYAICRTSDETSCTAGGNLQASGALSSDSLVYQTYSTWGGSSGIDITGLSSNTAYKFLVKARNGDGVETSFSSSSLSVYTLADQVSSPSVTNTTNTTTLQASITFTLPATLPSGMKIEQDSSCDNTFETGVYDSSTTNTSSPYLLTTGLTANTCYVFRFSSYNSDGVLNSSNRPTTASITLPPAQVTNVQTVSATTSEITWSWTQITDAVTYYLYNAITGALLGSVGAPTVQYIQSSLSANTSYSLFVRAFNSNGSGIASALVAAVTSASAPTSVTHTGQSVSLITWSWANSGQSGFYAQNKDTVSRNSGWITDNTWVESGLSANTQYTLQVKARNSESTETSYVESSAYTAQNAPSSVAFSNVSAGAISVSAEGTFTNLGSGSSVLHFDNGAGSTQNMTSTSSWSNTGLSTNTEYTYTVYATNGDGVQTSSVTGATTTHANTPDTPTVTASSATTLTLVINRASNSDSAQFSICRTSDGSSCATGGNLQTDGTLSSSGSAWQTYSAWGGATGITITGLTTGEPYRFLVKARNSASVQTAFSSANTAVYLQSATPATPTAEMVSKNKIRIYVNQNSNADSTTYLLCRTTNGTSCLSSGYVQSDGTLGSESNVWQTYSAWGGDSGQVISGLAANTPYKFLEKTKDAQGNESGFADPTDWVFTDVESTEVLKNTATVVVSESLPTIVLQGNPTTGLNSSVSTVQIPASIDEATEVSLDLSRGLSSQSVTMSSDLTVSRAIENSDETYQMFIPSSTIITAASSEWDGHIILPTKLQNSNVTTNFGNVQEAIQVGSNDRLDFDTPVKLVIPGEAGKLPAYLSTNGQSVGITTMCASASDASNIVGSGECYFYSGTDVIIWTKHFTTYFTYEPYGNATTFPTQQYIQTKDFVSPDTSRQVVIINSGSRVTTSSLVSLELNLSGANTMSISNSKDFSGSLFVPFSGRYNWELTPGNGLKTVYVKFKTSEGAVAEAIGTITLINQTVDQKETPDIGLVKLETPQKFVPVTGTLAKIPANPATYIFFADTWHLIVSEIVFNKLKFVWDWIKILEKTDFYYYEIGSPISTSTDKSLPTYMEVKKAAELNILNASTSTISVSNILTTTTRKFSFKFEKNIFPGEKNVNVRKLQQALSDLGYFNVTSTGYYGFQTIKSVKNFQRDNSIQITGTVGPKTRTILNNL